MVNDPNRLIKFEIAIKEKYGEETIRHPRANWDRTKETSYLKELREIAKEKRNINDTGDKIEVDGVLIPKKLIRKEKTRTCPSCNTYSFKSKDDLYMSKFNCCERCYILYVEGREEKWLQKMKKEKDSKKISKQK